METQTQTVTATTTPTAEKARPGRPRSISDETLRRAREMYASSPDVTIAAIAAEPWCDASQATLYYHLGGKSPKGDAKVEMRRKGRKGLKKEQKELLAQLHDQGLRLSQIRKDERFHNGVKPDGSPALFSLQTLSKELKLLGRTPHVGRPALEGNASEAKADAPEASANDAAPAAPAALAPVAVEEKAEEAEIVDAAPETEMAVRRVVHVTVEEQLVEVPAEQPAASAEEKPKRGKGGRFLPKNGG